MQHKSKIVIFILFLLILLVVLPVLSSVFIQFIDRVTLNPSLISASIIPETFKNPRTYTDFFSKTNPPNILCWLVLAIYVIYVFCIKSKESFRRIQNTLKIDSNLELEEFICHSSLALNHHVASIEPSIQNYI